MINLTTLVFKRVQALIFKAIIILTKDGTRYVGITLGLFAVNEYFLIMGIIHSVCFREQVARVALYKTELLKHG